MTPRRLHALAALAMLSLVPLAWPEEPELRRYPDSAYYLREARGNDLDSQHLYARRAPAYPLFLRIVPPGPFLVQAQSWLSLACWCLFGWTLRRTAGVLLLGLFALSPLVRPWNAALMTESLALSLLALLLALSLALRRALDRDGAKLRAPRTALLGAAWAATVLAFATVRDVHLLALPFAALVLLPARLPGRRAEWARFAAGSCVLLLVLVLGLRTSDAARRSTIPVYTALYQNVFSDAETLAAFRAAGLPDSRYPMSPAVEAWIEQGGRSRYLAWAASRLESHRTTWKMLAPPNASTHLVRRYFDGTARARFRWIESAARWVERASAPPNWLWLLAAVLLPPFAWWRTGHATGISFAPTVLAAMTYLFAFMSWWGAGTEMLRHGLVAWVLYRATFAVALAGWLSQFVTSRTNSRTPPHAHA